jgi:ATP-dependent DNA ligase
MVTHDYAAMEMRPVAKIPDGPGWQYEPKWDGFRCLAHRDGSEAALQRLSFDHYSFDGELIVPLAGALSFDALQQRIHPAASRVAMLSHKTPAIFMVFDLLREDGSDVVDEPLLRRRERLEDLARGFMPGGELRLSPATTSRDVVDRWFAQVGGALDGIVAKKIDARYASGRRDAAVKVKKMRTADCVVGGFRYAAGNTNSVGSLLLGLYDDGGLLDYIGFCSAFSNVERANLIQRLQPYIGGTGFTGAAPGDAPSRWSRDPDRDRSYVALDPKCVLEVEFDQVTGGRIRHGTRPLRWRVDKAANSCTVEQLQTGGTVSALLG